MDARHSTRHAARAVYVTADSLGQRSSRESETQVASRRSSPGVSGNHADHATIARFVVRHEAALAGLFGEVLSLCADAGMVKVGVLAIDGTKVHANASQHSNRDYEQIAREILTEAAETDRREDELYGDKRGDELPPQLGRPARVVVPGCATPGVGSMRSVQRSPSRSRAHARSG